MFAEPTYEGDAQVKGWSGKQTRKVKMADGAAKGKEGWCQRETRLAHSM